MIQYIIVGFLVVLATAYLGRMLFRSFKADSACEAGCAKCNVEKSISALNGEK